MPGNGPGWQQETTAFTAPVSGHYEVALATAGDSFVSLDGALLLADRGLHGRWSTSTTLSLEGGRRYSFGLDFFLPSGTGAPRLTIEDVDDAISSAVAAAAHSSVAVVFANDVESEGADRQSLALPGYENELISAVAAANPDTVVVLNTGGPVTMPWLHAVRAVLEAWYPGEEDGSAVAAVLFGAFDPSGRLPVTFPVNGTRTPVSSTAQWPGIDGVVDFSEGLDVGYRGYEADRIAPLFPFGYGMSYTSFELAKLRTYERPGHLVATLEVTDSGTRPGTEVIEAYLGYPVAAHEPPRQLRAFAAVELRPRRSAKVTLVLPASAFAAYVGGGFRPFRGDYTLFVGTSSNDLPLHASVGAPSRA